MNPSKRGSCGRGADDVDTSHLEDVEDGCGCAEVWERMSEHRDASD